MLINRRGEVKLSDFGIARRLDGTTADALEDGDEVVGGHGPGQWCKAAAISTAFPSSSSAVGSPCGGGFGSTMGERAQTFVGRLCYACV